MNQIKTKIPLMSTQHSSMPLPNSCCSKRRDHICLLWFASISTTGIHNTFLVDEHILVTPLMNNTFFVVSFLLQVIIFLEGLQFRNRLTICDIEFRGMVTYQCQQEKQTVSTKLTQCCNGTDRLLLQSKDYCCIEMHTIINSKWNS